MSNTLEHTVGSHSDDRGSESDHPCDRQDAKPQANTVGEILREAIAKSVLSQANLAAGHITVIKYTKDLDNFAKEAKAKIKALITEKVVKLANLYGEPRCENLHHSKKNQHTFIEVCPVVKAISEQLKENN